MSTTALPKKRKLIDLPEDTFKKLSVMAIAEGKSLKVFIENLLISKASSMNDEALYKHLTQTEPDGMEYISGKDKDDFEKLIGA